ncbi:hypothetical protein AB0O01_26350 [Streptomyces sp. NPDC093252]|uniref:hypothetical protein n=1 Tax=Streptomyces sp. NPDC093252 TaxID=3154980 RepID=UPI00341A8845
MADTDGTADRDGAGGTDGVRLGKEAARRLAALPGCDVAAGLSEAELARIERTYGFVFAADHRAFLAEGLPVASPPKRGAAWEQPWPDWRHGDPEDLRYRLEWPVREVLREVELGGWHQRAFGARPRGARAAVDMARRKLAEAPAMVPVYGHRFLPAGGGSYGHPVLSMWGTAIRCHSDHLVDYIEREFAGLDDGGPWDQETTVEVWSDFVIWRP